MTQFEYYTIVIYNVPLSQFVPVVPLTHKHWYALILSTQEAPFRQGALSHSFTSVSGKTGVYSGLIYI